MNSVWIVDENGSPQFEVNGTLDEDLPNMVAVPMPSTLLQPRWNGKSWVEMADGETVKSGLGSLQQAQIAALEVEAERVRATLYPVGPLALAVREQRLREATAVLYREGRFEPIFLAAESGVRGIDIKELASSVLAEQQSFAKRLSQVEVVRIKYQSALRGAADGAEAQSLFERGKESLWALTQSEPARDLGMTGGIKAPQPVPSETKKRIDETAETAPTEKPESAAEPREKTPEEPAAQPREKTPEEPAAQPPEKTPEEPVRDERNPE